MAKGKRRQREQARARARKDRAKAAGGKSKYALKRAQQVRGKFAPTSPFVLESHPDAQDVDHWIDPRGYRREGGAYVKDLETASTQGPT